MSKIVLIKDEDFEKWYAFGVLTLIGTVLFFYYKVKKVFHSIDIGAHSP